MIQDDIDIGVDKLIKETEQRAQKTDTYTHTVNDSSHCISETVQ